MAEPSNDAVITGDGSCLFADLETLFLRCR
jgi:hypothetical protein